MLSVKNLTASVGDKKILDNISYDFERGKVYAIMGPNGSGKSTLASVVMGHPVYELSDDSVITYNDEEIHELDSNERGEKGIFMSFQSPMSLSGVNVFQLLRYALDGKKDPLALKKEIEKYAKKLHIKEDLIMRSINEDFSGGEKKKMEILQALVLNPSLLFFDEIDTGVDVDALKTIAEAIKDMKSSDKTLVIITHYNRILKYLQPDEVVVIADGKIAATGDYKLAHMIETEGYSNVNAKK